MDLGIFIHMLPQIFLHQVVNIFTKRNKELKNPQTVSRECLDHRFQKYLFASWREELKLPIVDLLPHPIFNITESLFLGSAHKRREPKISINQVRFGQL